MKIYFAGVPGGSLREREKELFKLGINRLCSFYYLDQTEITIEEFIKNDNLLRRKRGNSKGKIVD
jgi:hypothetical protein